MSAPLISLPLVPSTPEEASAAPAPHWNGLTPVTLAAEPPEPELPQGEYAGPGETSLSVPRVDQELATRPVELLAPAGGPEAAFAALHYGADAIYLGLKKF